MDQTSSPSSEVALLAAEPAPPPAIEYVDEQDPTAGPGWRITDLSTADWAFARVADLEQEISENEAVVSQAMARLEDRLKRMNDRAMKGVAFFRSQLEAYATANREQLLKGGKKKSRELAHGKFAWRKSGGGLVVKDEAALLAWAQSQPVELGLVRIKEEAAIANIKKHAAAKSLIPPGMTETEAAESLDIEATLPELPAKGGK